MKKMFKVLKAFICIVCVCAISYVFMDKVERKHGDVSLISLINTSKEKIEEVIDENIIKNVDNNNILKANSRREVDQTTLMEEKTSGKKVEKKFIEKEDKGEYIYEFSEPLSELDVGNNSYVSLLASDEKQLKKQIYRGLLFRKENIDIDYSGSNIEEIVGKIKEITDDILKRYDNKATANDFDYLDNDIKSIKFKTRWNIINAKISISVSYLDNKEQQSYVDSRVKDILRNLNIKKKSEYEKIKAVHDWIIKNVSYDDSKHLHSAYAGLRYGKTVCQGYAMLTYKMLTEAGVKCRIISGSAYNGKETESHAWNIAQLNGKWYYLDTTWDDGTSSNKYFLTGSTTMEKDHFSSEMFNTKEFLKHYKISKSSFLAAH